MNKAFSIWFNGSSLDYLNVGWQTTSRPLPKKKEHIFTPSASDSSYDFSAYNPENRPHYDDIEIAGKIFITEKDLGSSHAKLTEVLKFLMSPNGQYADLSFDDSPNRTYSAVYTGCASTYKGRTIELSVTFRCRPFPSSGNPSYAVYVNNYNITVNLPVASWYTKMKLTCRGSFTRIIIEDVATGKQLNYGGVSVAGDTTVIDFQLHNTSKNGVDVNNVVTGEYWELSPYSTNENQIKLTVTGTANIEIDYDLLEVY